MRIDLVFWSLPGADHGFLSPQKTSNNGWRFTVTLTWRPTACPQLRLAFSDSICPRYTRASMTLKARHPRSPLCNVLRGPSCCLWNSVIWMLTRVLMRTAAYSSESEYLVTSRACSAVIYLCSMEALVFPPHIERTPGHAVEQLRTTSKQTSEYEVHSCTLIS